MRKLSILDTNQTHLRNISKIQNIIICPSQVEKESREYKNKRRLSILDRNQIYLVNTSKIQNLNVCPAQVERESRKDRN